MARQRKPPSLHVVQGTYRKDRHGPLPSPLAHLAPLGEPPADWRPGLKAIWVELASMVPLGIAGRHDRLAFEALVRLTAMMRAKPERLTPALCGQIRAACGAFAMTPADRARFAPPPLPSDNPVAKFVR